LGPKEVVLMKKTADKKFRDTVPLRRQKKNKLPSVVLTLENQLLSAVAILNLQNMRSPLS
jgi:hypothetical protein